MEPLVVHRQKTRLSEDLLDLLFAAITHQLVARSVHPPLPPAKKPVDKTSRALYKTIRLINLTVNYMTTDRLSNTFAALADPTRRAILAQLLLGERSVGELAGPFQMSAPAVSKHLRVLERAGLIAQRRDAQWRRCRITADPLKEVSDWTERYRQIWEERLDRLDEYVQQLNAKEKKRHGRKQRSK